MTPCFVQLAQNIVLCCCLAEVLRLGAFSSLLKLMNKNEFVLKLLIVHSKVLACYKI